MNRREMCSVIVNSCDKYEDAWYPFFELVKKYWKDCSFPFFLNTENKFYKHPGMDITTINYVPSIDKNTWGDRMLQCIDKIDTPFVILFLEDFFLQQPVDEQELDSCISMMEENENIVAIYFKQIEGYTNQYEFNDKYYHMAENKRYKLNLQAGLWRTEILKQLISKDDSPWSLEEEGCARDTNPNHIYLCSKCGTHTDMQNCVFPYLTGRNTGYGIWQGKWMWNNDKLFSSNGIRLTKMDMERFGRIDMLKYYMRRVKEKMLGKA